MGSANIKKVAATLGADLCGIAPVSRFEGAPPGFRPIDIYPDCKSVIVFAKRLPLGSLRASNCIPYTFVNSWIAQHVDGLTIALAYELEKMGMNAVPIPSDDPYEHWETDRSYGRAILSMRHAGWLAGLGVLGKNTLLINKNYGNMIQIGAVLIDKEYEADPLADYSVCPSECTLCIDNCPQGALDGTTVNQQLCRPLSNYHTEKGYIIKKCGLCRSICPNALGLTL